MKCPECQAEMMRGYLYGDRFSLKWLPESTPLFLGIWAFGGKTIGTSHFMLGGRHKAKCYRCEKCKLSMIKNDGL
jgi:hypothetical protein